MVRLHQERGILLPCWGPQPGLQWKAAPHSLQNKARATPPHLLQGPAGLSPERGGRSHLTQQPAQWEGSFFSVCLSLPPSLPAFLPNCMLFSL